MDLLSGLEQFGINVEQENTEIYAEEKRKEQNKVKTSDEKTVVRAKRPETEFLFTKRIRCTICDRVFDVRMVKNARVKRLQPDFDLRPRFENIDTLKYDVYACPYCGYAAMGRYFEHLTKGQIQLVKDNVCANFKRTGDAEPDSYTYEQAIARYKLALYNSIVKRAKTSEKAYTCLKISWLYREMAGMDAASEEEKAKKAEYEKLQEEFYKEAYEGFQKALATETFPMCGMDSFTMDYLIASMACHFKDFSYASKAVSNILSSQIADRRIKNRALELKEEIIAQIRNESNN
ncbi:DUF2225 domain-containing protein [Roseburia sp. BX1005]|uniref:DUF2225 domain-containing protein n=1 Tax=Roseburia zhanii TaxID=2763064 RepID=A0A923LRG5_9FIRM|nr:DUF2225 domain-containing protein [Roseburia zhanii]MBC5714541.1 DUF2225 domain-containing protein [Roseburia zhanii]